MKMVDHHEIYRSQAARYQQLVAREDYQGNILRALTRICDPDDRIIVDLGTGSGRLMKLLAPRAKMVYGFDRSPAMLKEAQQQLQRTGLANWMVGNAEHRQIPIAGQSCDLIVSGWSLCYLALDRGPQWRDEFRAALRRLGQALQPAGSIIILETLGTGVAEPNPPSKMRDYLHFLAELGLQSTWIRTDYQFESLAEAIRLLRFFFGDSLAKQVAQTGAPIVPECTGIWWSNDLQKLHLD